MTTNILIQNPSFEQESTPPSAGKCGRSGWQGQSGFEIPGWTFGAASGVIQLANPNPCNIPVPLPDGTFAAYAGNATIIQDTGVRASDVQANAGPQRTGTYALTFSVTDFYPPYPGYFTAELSLGTTDAQGVIHVGHELCSQDGLTTLKWSQITMSCPSPGYTIYDGWPDGSPFDPNAHLIISLTANPNWWEILFDNVALTFTPTN